METITAPVTIAEQIKQETPRFNQLINEVAKVVVGHTDIVTFIIISILCDGHVLLKVFQALQKQR